MSGEINLPIKEQTWAQNHVLQILTYYVHYSIYYGKARFTPVTPLP